MRTIFFIIFTFISITTVRAQSWSIRSNILNLLAKGPSVTIGKKLNPTHKLVVTYSSGTFKPFGWEDYYHYKTVHAEYRFTETWLTTPYFGPYVRYIDRTIITEGSSAGPYGIFSKRPRAFSGQGISTGVTAGHEWKLSKKLLVDLNFMLGFGKYVKQADYATGQKSNLFFDSRFAVQFGYVFL